MTAASGQSRTGGLQGGTDEHTAPAALALCRELPRGVDDVQHDDRVGDELHESDVGKPVDDEFPRARYPVAVSDPLGEYGTA